MNKKKTSTHNVWNAKLVLKPTEASESNLIALLDKLNDLSKMLQKEADEATQKYQFTRFPFFLGKEKTSLNIKLLLDDIIKSV
jgi:hypothetical protein